MDTQLLGCLVLLSRVAGIGGDLTNSGTRAGDKGGRFVATGG